MDTRQKSKTGHSQRRSATAGSRRKAGNAPSAEKERKKKSKPENVIKRRHTTREVTYTPAKPFSRNRFLLQLVTVAAVVIAVILGMSIFFKVDNIVVYGNEKYSAWTVREASGIQEKENLLTLGRPRAVYKILDALPYVKDARIGIKLPSTVNIYIEEYDVVYAVKERNGSWWLMRSDGVLTESTDAAYASDYTKILGVELTEAAAGEMVQAAETATVPETTEADPTEETLVIQPVVVTAKQRLDTALKILQYLEENDVIGEVTSVDVTDLSNIELWYGEQYQVQLGDTGKLDYKIWYMKNALDQMEDYQSGTLDVSFTIWTDKAGFIPF